MPLLKCRIKNEIPIVICFIVVTSKRVMVNGNTNITLNTNCYFSMDFCVVFNTIRRITTLTTLQIFRKHLTQ